MLLLGVGCVHSYLLCCCSLLFASFLLIGLGCVLSCGWTAVHVDTFACFLASCCVLAVGDVSIALAVACIGGEWYVGVVLSSALLY
jgi:O-antigen ligase